MGFMYIWQGILNLGFPDPVLFAQNRTKHIVEIKSNPWHKNPLSIRYYIHINPHHQGDFTFAKILKTLSKLCCFALDFW
jgi:hypothetical protein